MEAIIITVFVVGLLYFINRVSKKPPKKVIQNRPSNYQQIRKYPKSDLSLYGPNKSENPKVSKQVKNNSDSWYKEDIGFQLSLKIVEPSCPLKSGDKIELWIKPNSTSVRMYYASDRFTYGSHVAITKSKQLVDRFDSDRYNLKGEVHSVVGDRVYLSKFITVHDKRQSNFNVVSKFLDRIEVAAKKPLKTTITCCMPEQFPWNSKVFICFGNIKNASSRAELEESWSVFNDEIWLNDISGQKISLSTTCKRQELINILRNHKSGFIMHCKYNKDFHGSYCEEGKTMSWDLIVNSVE